MHEDNNPKTRSGRLKVPMHLIPPAAKIELARALEDGAKKYSPYNWREEPISTSVYYGAIQRHIDAWWDGEEVAKDSNVHHLAHVMACCAIIIDSIQAASLIDDRPPRGSAAAMLDYYTRCADD
jgi:hypothetical protein